MTEIVTERNLDEYENFVRCHANGHFMQSKIWSKVKTEWKWQAVLCRDDDGKILGSIAVLIRKLPKLPYSIMYACRGPVCDYSDKETLTQLICALKSIAKQDKAYVLKLDPDVTCDNTKFVSCIEELGFKCVSNGKNFEGIQPKFVFRLDVSGMEEGSSIEHFHSKTRYNIRYAQRKGVNVKVCTKEMLDDFSRIMLDTGLRDGFVTRPKAYFEKMMDELSDNCRLYMAFFDGKPIAGTIAVLFGDKVWYLYGASCNEYRNLMPNYLLQWEMIKWAISEGCSIYDFRGVSGDISEDNPLYGLYRFKKGFNGQLCEFIGEYELAFNRITNFMVANGQKWYRTFRRRIFLKKNMGKDTSKPKNLTGKH